MGQQTSTRLRALVAVSDLVIALPEVHELDIDPLLAEASGVLALMRASWSRRTRSRRRRVSPFGPIPPNSPIQSTSMVRAR
jgi:hypothetical protein